VRIIAAIAALLYSASVTPSEVKLQWWQPYEFGRCTKTDIKELGGCGRLEVKRKPKWQ
jgi:hypothetical protein